MEYDGMDIDGILMSCRNCGRDVYFGDYFHGKNKCIDCIEEKENPSLPLIRLVEKTLRSDECGDA